VLAIRQNRPEKVSPIRTPKIVAREAAGNFPREERDAGPTGRSSVREEKKEVVCHGWATNEAKGGRAITALPRACSESEGRNGGLFRQGPVIKDGRKGGRN